MSKRKTQRSNFPGKGMVQKKDMTAEAVLKFINNGFPLSMINYETIRAQSAKDVLKLIEMGVPSSSIDYSQIRVQNAEDACKLIEMGVPQKSIVIHVKSAAEARALIEMGVPLDAMKISSKIRNNMAVAKLDIKHNPDRYPFLADVVSAEALKAFWETAYGIKPNKNQDKDNL